MMYTYIHSIYTHMYAPPAMMYTYIGIYEDVYIGIREDIYMMYICIHIICIHAFPPTCYDVEEKKKCIRI